MNCGKEGEVEAEEHQERREARPGFRVEPSGDLRPPEVQTGEIGRHRAADHDVVEMRDDEVGAGDLHVDGNRGEEETGQPADGEQTDESERIQHRRLERDLPAIEGRRPVEDLDRRRHGDDERKERKHEVGEGRLSRHEHVMAPDGEADDRDRQHRIDHRRIAEHAPSREAGDDLGNRRQTPAGS